MVTVELDELLMSLLALTSESRSGVEMGDRAGKGQWSENLERGKLP